MYDVVLCLRDFWGVQIQKWETASLSYFFFTKESLASRPQGLCKFVGLGFSLKIICFSTCCQPVWKCLFSSHGWCSLVLCFKSQCFLFSEFSELFLCFNYLCSMWNCARGETAPRVGGQSPTNHPSKSPSPSHQLRFTLPSGPSLPPISVALQLRCHLYKA